jgi:hypothetical protein
MEREELLQKIKKRRAARSGERLQGGVIFGSMRGERWGHET